ncbi:hypothetical protein [Nonomuraea sp. NPDC048826]|uniref:hypothetical protein n=1 Tax=Nonomuraea sp. NPDC048826 TaxID=3364347 RepID=UPI003717833A
MTRAERAVRRMLPGRTGAALEPLRLVRPHTPALFAITTPTFISCITRVTILCGGGRTARASAAGASDLHGLASGDLLAARRDILLG